MTTCTRVHSMSSCEFSHPNCLIIPPKLLHVDVTLMFATEFCSYSRSSLHVHMLCSLWKHLSHSHTKSHTLSRKRRHSRPTINPKCRTCHSHCQSIMLSMCVWMVWVVSLSSHVSVCLQDHVCIFHSFTHLVTLLKFWRRDSPLTVGPSLCHQLDQLSPRTVQKHQAIHFKVSCPQIDQSTFMLVN